MLNPPFYVAGLFAVICCMHDRKGAGIKIRIKSKKDLIFGKPIGF